MRRSSQPKAVGCGGRPNNLCLATDAFCSFDTTKQSNTHSTDSREVLYPWHAWHGRPVWIHALEHSARHNTDAAVGAGRGADDLQRTHDETHHEKQSRSHFPECIRETITQAHCHDFRSLLPVMRGLIPAHRLEDSFEPPSTWVYDINNNVGCVSVGTDHDTASFAVHAICRWWRTMGKKRYPRAKRLMITADGGGSDGYRVRLWKVELQKLADELKLPVTVCHMPPGTSKWNKIGHCLFSFISINWRGKPLRTYRTIVQLIAPYGVR